MKKILLVSAIAFSLSPFVYAQKKESVKTKPSNEIKAAFDKKFPGAKDVKWEKEDGQFEANFKLQQKEMSALFDQSGMCTETETEIAIKELPAAAHEYLKQHYSNQKIKAAAKIQKANGELIYEAEVNKTDLLFDANGKFLKKQKD